MPQFTANACSISRPAPLPISQPLQLKWEWRTFDYQPQRWATLLHRVELIRSPEPTTEIYLLSPQCPDKVTLRDGRVEMERLLRTNINGLELWQPVLTATFPLEPATIFELCDSWGADCPTLLPVIGTAEVFLTWIDRVLPGVRVLPVRTLRRRFRLMQCEGEWTSIESGDSRLETLTLQHHDPAVVLGAMSELRLLGAPNINYTQGLKRFLGWHLDSAHCVLPGASR